MIAPRVQCGVRRSAIVLLAIGSLARAAAADEHLSRARVELANVELEKAEASVAAGLDAGASTRAELIELYLLGGQIAASLGRDEVAVDRFRRALALDPKHELVGVAPKISAPFARAKAFYASRAPLQVEHTVVREPERAVVLRIVSDPMKMVAEARITDVRTGETIRVSGASELRVPVPGARRREVIASIHDRRGNELDAIGSKAVPIVVEATGAAQGAEPPGPGEPSPPRAARAPGRSIAGRWYVWLGAGALAGGAATYFGLGARAAERDLSALNQESEGVTFDEARAIEDRWRRDALVANISLGAAAVCGVVATILIVRDARRPARPARGALRVEPARGGATAAFSMRF